MSNDIDKFEILLTLMQDNKKDLEKVRSSLHDVRDYMQGLAGSIELVRANQESKQAQDNQRFETVHHRIDKDQASNEKKFSEVQATLNDIAPKVSHMNKIFDWATRIIVTALVGAVLWALVQYGTVK